MRNRLTGLIAATGLILGAAATADAQVGISIGNPYTGRGLSIGVPAYSGYGYNNSYGYNGYGYNNYSSPYYGYNNVYSYPSYSYSSGYSGYVNPGYAGSSYGYGTTYAAPSYGYSSYAYPNYGYRSYGGYRSRMPFGRLLGGFRRW